MSEETKGMPITQDGIDAAVDAVRHMLEQALRDGSLVSVTMTQGERERDPDLASGEEPGWRYFEPDGTKTVTIEVSRRATRGEP